MTKFTKNSRF